jgi:hypothetical protein
MGPPSSDVAGQVDHGRRLLVRLAGGVAALMAGGLFGATLAVIIVTGPLDAISTTSKLVEYYYKYVFDKYTPAPSTFGIIAEMEWKVALLSALIIAITATPIWLVIERFRRGTLTAAALLGAMLTTLAAINSVRDDLDWSHAHAWVVFGLLTIAGGLSGMITWRLSHSPAVR